jgi:putative acetyltransferase
MGPAGDHGGHRAARPIRIVEARTERDLAAARSLIEEYARSLPVDLGFQGYQEEMAEFPRSYAAPDGTILLAYHRSRAIGVVALRRLQEHVGEMKRLYVCPNFRARGIGRALVRRLLRSARALGYLRLRLDTLPSMDAAIGLYRALGFRDVSAYRPNPVPGARFLELELRDISRAPSRDS